MQYGTIVVSFSVFREYFFIAWLDHCPVFAFCSIEIQTYSAVRQERSLQRKAEGSWTV